MAKNILSKINISNLNTGLNKDDLKNRIKESESRDDLIIITDDIKTSNLSAPDKTELLKSIVIEYQKKYSELSKDYSELKKDIQFLLTDIKNYTGLTQIAFILIAKRLKKIRDNELYKPEYKDFKSFFESEINKSKPTIYFYISVIETFKEMFEKSYQLDFDIQYSKLIPFLPLLKNKEIPDNEKQDIKNNAVYLVKSDKSQKDIILIAKDYKSKYGLIKESELNIDKLVNGIIKKIPSENKAETIQEIIDKLNDLL
jgi:hypothetical protein